MDEISMRAVKLDDFKSSLESPSRGCCERFDNHVYIGDGKLCRNRVSHIERDRTGGDRLPPSVSKANRTGALPWHIRTRLSTSVGKLYSRNGTILLEKSRDSGKRLDVFVAPDAEVPWRDAASCFNRARFG